MSFLSLLRFRRLLAWEKPMVSVRFMTSGNKNSSPSKGLSYPGKPKHSSSYQAIIIGGGHNGLVAAAYLQLAGFKKVCVLERRHVVGGAAVTEEIVPGFHFSRASYLLSLLRPSIINDLELKKHGLKLHLRDPSSYTPLSSDYWKGDGPRSLTLSSDLDFNRKQISKFSKRDAEVYESYEKWLSRLVAAIDPLIDSKAVDLNFPGSFYSNIKSLMTVAKSAYKLRKDIGSFYDLMTAPASKLLDQFFESEPLKATLATDAVIGAMMGPHSIGSGYVLLHHVMGGVEGKQGAWAYPEGGMGAVSSAMAKSAVEKGATIFTDQTVKEIMVDDGGSVAGVRLTDGTEILSKVVLSNATPQVTFINLLASGTLPESYLNKVKSVDYTSPVTKINVALNALPNFLADPYAPGSGKAAPHHRCTIHLNCEESHMLDKAFQQGQQGLIPDRPMIEMTIPSSLDPTISPKGCHVALLFTQYRPYELQNGVQWDDHWKEVYAKRIFQQIDEYAPGFQQSIVGYEVLTPPDLERIFGLTGGNIFHGAISLDQLYLSRPFSSWKAHNQRDHYPSLPRTPIKGLYICGSGAHPGGGVMGTPGRLAAEQVIQETNL
ncbi:pyridine nucleotide-disulfide oxidoreductase domain-containing protein 2-like isoform X2 [Daphnia pulicaria]|uniref:pyridine nucleotide-disulfide oxidoreductase domain-containing protein 2-like isoform X2 n=1 Tax=Daphnia pulicaria TaxID=35523 RepID=UPI001EEB27DA|nr:pyridine nucleotide-disulfide oxidoreductase domain-containing protein 2-like isoform X2 [Daphnia pulicaria]